jgi:hypothetical protein
VVTVPGYRSRDPGLGSRRFQIFWEVVGLERGPLSHVSEELLEWKSSGSGPRKSRLTAVWNPLRWPRDTLYPQKLALTSPIIGGRSVGIVLLRTKATEFRLFLVQYTWESDRENNAWKIFTDLYVFIPPSITKTWIFKCRLCVCLCPSLTPERLNRVHAYSVLEDFIPRRSVSGVYDRSQIRNYGPLSETKKNT